MEANQIGGKSIGVKIDFSGANIQGSKIGNKVHYGKDSDVDLSYKETEISDTEVDNDIEEISAPASAKPSESLAGKILGGIGSGAAGAAVKGLIGYVTDKLTK